MADTNFRHSARALIVDRDDRVLLCRQTIPSVPPAVVWTAPGGGVEAGETPMEALARELLEEVGLGLPSAVPLVWVQRIESPGYVTGFDGVVNDYFLVRTTAFAPRGSFTDAELQQETITDFRWWTVGELGAHRGPEVFSPRRLAALLASLLADGPPPTATLIAL